VRTLYICTVLIASGLAGGCTCFQARQPLEGVAVEKVINQIKHDLEHTSLSNEVVGDGKIPACGEDGGKPFVLIRDRDTLPKVTLKLQTVRTVDVTGDIGAAKLPVAAILFSGDFSYENKRQVTREQDLTFDVVLAKDAKGKVIQTPVPSSDYSALGKEIDGAEQGVINTDHALSPCLRPKQLTVTVIIDVTRTTTVSGGVGFLVLYAATAKSARSTEQKNQVIVDLTYSKATPAALL
jgi:hypothetical protein